MVTRIGFVDDSKLVRGVVNLIIDNISSDITPNTINVYEDPNKLLDNIRNYDIVITDLLMPKKNGLMLAYGIRKKEKDKKNKKRDIYICSSLDGKLKDELQDATNDVGLDVVVYRKTELVDLFENITNKDINFDVIYVQNKRVAEIFDNKKYKIMSGTINLRDLISSLSTHSNIIIPKAGKNLDNNLSNILDEYKNRIMVVDSAEIMPVRDALERYSKTVLHNIGRYKEEFYNELNHAIDYIKSDK